EGVTLDASSGGTLSYGSDGVLQYVSPSFVSLLEMGDAGTTIMGANGISLVGEVISDHTISYTSELAISNDFNLINRGYANNNYWKTSGTTSISAPAMIEVPSNSYGVSFKLGSSLTDSIKIHSPTGGRPRMSFYDGSNSGYVWMTNSGMAVESSIGAELSSGSNRISIS